MQLSILATVLYTLALSKQAVGHGFVADIKAGNTWWKGSDPFNQQGNDPKKTIVWSFYGSGDGPVQDVSSKAITCNGNAKAASASAPIKAGDEVDLVWSRWPDDHKGPVMTYLAKCPGKCSDVSDPSTLGWFKIDEDGYHASDGTWGSDKLISKNHSWTVKIPADIKSGDYILRHEILALHGAGKLNGAQFYPSCANLEISGDGNAEPETVKFPGAYKNTDPGVSINIWWPTPTDYKVPGPTVYKAGNKPVATGSSSPISGTVVTGSITSASKSSSGSTTTLAPSKILAQSVITSGLQAAVVTVRPTVINTVTVTDY